MKGASVFQDAEMVLLSKRKKTYLTTGRETYKHAALTIGSSKQSNPGVSEWTLIIEDPQSQ